MYTILRTSQLTNVAWRAFNYPFNLSFGPLIGAISGGNTVVLKPSENAPACAAVMQKIMAASLDPDCYACIQGGMPETQALLAEKWDKIFFTGSSSTGNLAYANGNTWPQVYDTLGRYVFLNVTADL